MVDEANNLELIVERAESLCRSLAPLDLNL